MDRPSFRNAVACGTAAFVGWVLSELIKGTTGRWFSVAMTCGLIGGAAGVGLALAAAPVGAGRTWPWRRILSGVVVGGIAGAIGGSIGNLFQGLPPWSRAPGWAVMGAGLGAIDGLVGRSKGKLDAGLVGGAAGGLIGGLGFHGAFVALAVVSDPAGRAAAFIALGACIGAMIGVAKGLFAEAWLTVLDGDRPRRRLVLDAPSLLIGRADHAALTFRGIGETGVDKEHARVSRLDDGRYILEDNHSRHGTTVNLRRVVDRVELADGDVIRVGPNSIQFRTRTRSRDRTHETPRLDSRPPAPAERIQGGTLAPVPAPRAGPPLPRGMSSCPRCHRPVPGTRPYCIVCKISF